MRSIKSLAAGIAVALLLSTGAFAGSDLNEVGAFLVYPTIVGTSLAPLSNVETFVTITNAGPAAVYAHVSYINGNGADPKYCYECDFEIPLSGNDTETLIITTDAGGTRIVAEDLFLDMSCPWAFGMLVVSLEDGMGTTIYENVLLGEEVIVDYTNGTAISIPAIPFQGGDAGDGDRIYEMDDLEYGKMPRIVAADFLAPDINGTGVAALSLFTLNFERQFPPLADCSVIGFDADEHPFSGSFQFGCWGFADLCWISEEFCHPNLGLFTNPLLPPDTHGWLQLNCRVDENPLAADGFEADGGVHGAIIQYQEGGASSLAAGSGQLFNNAAAWGRLLYQSVTTGDAVTLLLEEPAGGLF